MYHNLSSAIKITKCADHTAAGTTDVEGTILDMSGYTGVLFLTSYGTANANNILKVQQDDVNAAGGMADLEGTGVVTGTSDEDTWVDVYKPGKRYVRDIAVVDTSSTVESLWAFQYGAAKEPVDNTTTGTIIGEVHDSPAEGT